MKSLLRKYIIALLAVIFVSQLKTGLVIREGWQNYASAAISLTVVLLLKPLIDTLMLPINLLTLNLTNWLMFIGLIFLWSLMASQATFIPYRIQSANLGPVSLSAAEFSAWQAGIISSFLAVPIGYISYFFLHYELSVVDFFARLSFASFSIPNFPFFLMILIYIYFIYRLFSRSVTHFFTEPF